MNALEPHHEQPLRRHAPARFPSPAHQRGVVLIVALVFLVLLTLLAIGASSGSLLQQRMVAATRSAQLAVMSGDTALRGAEWQIWSSAAKVGGGFTCDADDINAKTGCVQYGPTVTSLYGANGTVTDFRTANNQWLSLTGPVTYQGVGNAHYIDQGSGYETANVAENPQYIIECMGPVKPPGSGVLHEGGDTGLTGSGPGKLVTYLFRITARATGGNQHMVRVVESTFDAQLNPPVC